MLVLIFILTWFDSHNWKNNKNGDAYEFRRKEYRIARTSTQ